MSRQSGAISELADAGHDRPAGQLRSGEGGGERDAVERNGRKRGLRCVGHRIVECAGSLLAERLGRVGCTREHASLGIQQRHRPLIVWPLLLDQFLEYRDRRTEGERIGHFAIAKHGNFHGHDRPFLGRTDEQVRILRRLACKHPLDDLSIVARRQARCFRRHGRKQLPAGSVGQQQDAVSAILAREFDRQPAEAVEIAALQGIAEREHLQAARHPLHLGVEHEAHASHGLQHPARCLAAILAIVGIGEADGKTISGNIVPATRRASRTGRVSFDKRGRPGSSAAAPDHDFGRTIRAVLARCHDFHGRSDPAKDAATQSGVASDHRDRGSAAGGTGGALRRRGRPAQAK